MRNLLTWSLPLGQLFGIPIRVHVLFPVVVLGLILREVMPRDKPEGLWLDVCVVMVVLFASVLLHEFGHCYGARWVDGEAHEVLLWPLGGLAGIDVPHTPRAHFIATAAGPAVNLLLFLSAALILAFSGLLAPWNPLTYIYRPQVYNWKEHVDYIAQYKDPAKAAAEPAPAPGEPKGKESTDEHGKSSSLILPWWKTLLAHVFVVNYLLFLLNVFLFAFPLDGGRMFQCLLWPRLGFRQSMLVTLYVGFIVMLLLFVVAVAANEVLPLCLAGIIFLSSAQQMMLLETGGEEALFGYDFSQGYTSLERDRPPPRRRPNFWQRWKQRRAAQKLQREQEQREAEERRMDELLEKVQHQGLQSLTDEERRFLTRVSAKYRNRP
jgi:Zn-dependent protease